jgi:tryptophanyl-tRNA synthetase
MTRGHRSIGISVTQDRLAIRIMSGMRPTGRLHLGHFFGTLSAWLSLAQQGDAYFEIADLHALTTRFREPQLVRSMRNEMVLDWLAVGIDPKRATIFLQSGISEISELQALLAMITPLAWLQRVPTFKDQIEALGPEIATYGFLGYPLLQLCDIAVFKAECVPIGRDQLPHLELGREIVRRFNHFYATEQAPVLVEPQPKFTEFPAVPGTDGRKMSKSYDNTIALSDDTKTVQDRVRSMITDPLKVRRNDPGRPEICPVFALQQLVNVAAVPEIEAGCRSGELGCVSCKTMLATGLNAVLDPIRERRAIVLKDATLIDDVIADGTARARVVAAQTLHEVKTAMSLTL